MEFTIYALGGSKHYSGESRYVIDRNSGILTVYEDDGTRHQYSPAHWQSVKDRPDQSVPVIDTVF